MCGEPMRGYMKKKCKKIRKFWSPNSSEILTKFEVLDKINEDP